MAKFAVVTLFLFQTIHASYALLAGRGACPNSLNSNRTATSNTFVAANCNLLTNSAAVLSCQRFAARPTLTNTGTASVVVPCSATSGDIIQGPQFIIPSPASGFYVDVEVVNASSTSTAGMTNYLSFDPNTGYIQVGATRPTNTDVTQVYSVVLINRATGAASDPVYFTAKILTCSLTLAGPKSFTICAGSQLNPAGVYTGISYPVCTSGATGINFDFDAMTFPGPPAGVGTMDPGLPGAFCPTLQGTPSNGDTQPCYLRSQQGGVADTFGPGSAIPLCVQNDFTTGVVPPATTCTANDIFSELLLVSADGSVAGGLPTIGTYLINVTIDPTCNSLAAKNIVCI